MKKHIKPCVCETCIKARKEMAEESRLEGFKQGMDDSKEVDKVLIQEEALDDLKKSLLSKWPPDQEEPVGITDFGDGFADGYNRGIRECKTIIEKL